MPCSRLRAAVGLSEELAEASPSCCDIMLALPEPGWLTSEQRQGPGREPPGDSRKGSHPPAPPQDSAFVGYEKITFPAIYGRMS